MNENQEETNKQSQKMGPSEEKQLYEARTILMSAPVDAELAHTINTKLLAMECADKKKPIYLFINSPGGEVHSGFAIFDTIRFVSCPVMTIVSGIAASMGSIIALAAPKERRFALPNAKFLIHQPSVAGGLGGSVSDIEIHAKDLIDTKNHIVRLYADETRKSEETIRQTLDRDYWMSATMAQEFGLISRIVDRRDQL